MTEESIIKLTWSQANDLECILNELVNWDDLCQSEKDAVVAFIEQVKH